MVMMQKQFARELAAYARGVFKGPPGCDGLLRRLRVTAEFDYPKDLFMVHVAVQDRQAQKLLPLPSIRVRREEIEDAAWEQPIDEALVTWGAQNAAGYVAHEVEHPVVTAIGRLQRP